jgi:hypothetical protein
MARDQLSLAIHRTKEPDRNAQMGGRSFYFFDFDDNIAFLSTACYLFHKTTGERAILTSREFTLQSEEIGRSGPWQDYEIRWDEQAGTFQNFRDQYVPDVEKWLEGTGEKFVEDLAHALGFPEFHWQGPSWAYFHHAVFNQRPLSVITARGHHPQTLKAGISLFVKEGHLPEEPNYLSLYPVNHPEIRHQLSSGDENISTPELKRRAIRASVEEALRIYGYSDYHRFGMSDDDPKNVNAILEEMTFLKQKYPAMSFFVIEARGGSVVKTEVLGNSTNNEKAPFEEQLRLWR